MKHTPGHQSTMMRCSACEGVAELIPMLSLEKWFCSFRSSCIIRVLQRTTA